MGHPKKFKWFQQIKDIIKKVNTKKIFKLTFKAKFNNHNKIILIV